ALYANEIPFSFRVVGPGDPQAGEELARLWPMNRFPVLVDDGVTVIESSIIIEHLMLHHPGRLRLIPADPKAALEARFLDRFFDNYVQTPLQKVVSDAMRPAGERDARGVGDARAMLETSYAWLERHMAGREWAAGGAFSLADCAAAPALFYADWTHAIGPQFPVVRAYRARLNAYPAFARAIDGGRPYRPLFPLGAPDRD
ncbi:MAG: glutathione S-transferase family protein, partial [Phreatobacter sp.]|nr:glutathione S-transferase family protein [Phreatobacter sp.]